MLKRSIKSLSVLILSASLLLGFGWSPAYGAIPEMKSSPADMNYSKMHFDDSAAIAQAKSEAVLVPQPAAINITVTDAKGATGSELVASRAEGNTSDFYLNAYVAYNALTIAPQNGAAIASITSSAGRTVELANGSANYVPAAINADNPVDEVLTVTMADGAVYRIHTVPEDLPDMQVTGSGVSADNAGIYTFYSHNFLLRVASSGEVIYYRNMTCEKYTKDGTTGLNFSFEPHTTPDGVFYSYYVHLLPNLGGKAMGMWVIMDKNYHEIDQVTMAPNDDPNHPHGESYLDFHEIRVLGENNYLTLSYIKQHVTNLPDSVPSVNGTGEAYVLSGIFQQIKDDKVVWEINTTDYPLLYESSIEGCDYAASSEENYLDYVHPNALDYLLDDNGNVTKLLVSLRDQSAVYQFNTADGAIDFILGGEASTLSGYDEFTRDRLDDMGNTFKSLTFGQHYCRYQNRNDKGQIPAGENPIVSLFDNQTGSRPFQTDSEIPTTTRTFCAEIDEDAATARIFDVVTAEHMGELNPEKYYVSDHCAAVDYFNDHSVAIGWGFLSPIDNLTEDQAVTDKNYPNLKLYEGVHPILTDYDMANDKIAFEISAVRNAAYPNAGFTYRAYKTAPEGRDSAVTFAVGQKDYYLANTQKTMDTTPVINSDNRTLVPVRFVAEALGAEVTWNANDQTVTVVRDGKTVVMTIGEEGYSIDGKAMTMDTVPVINADSRTMVPVRFVMEALGATVDYANGFITIA